MPAKTKRASKRKLSLNSARKTRSSAKPLTRKRKKRHYEGPREWLFPMLEETYARLGPKEETEEALRAIAMPTAAAAKREGLKGGKKAPAERTALKPNEEAMSDLPRTYWEERMREFHERKVRQRSLIPMLAGVISGQPAVPGQNNWTPLGPGVVARGQTDNRAAVSGRVSGIAIAPGGSRVYVATANGGVFRSDNGGESWRSTMDGFDQDPLNFASTSLACGAIAINEASPDRVYVGTGEGDTDGLFAARIINALPSYRGIGPIRSDDGGVTWVLETSSPSLAGFSFYQIAVDPGDAEHCVAATTNGLYERVPAGGGSFTWQRRRRREFTQVS